MLTEVTGSRKQAKAGLRGGVAPTGFAVCQCEVSESGQSSRLVISTRRVLEMWVTGRVLESTPRSCGLASVVCQFPIGFQFRK